MLISMSKLVHVLWSKSQSFKRILNDGWRHALYPKTRQCQNTAVSSLKETPYCLPTRVWYGVVVYAFQVWCMCFLVTAMVCLIKLCTRCNGACFVCWYIIEIFSTDKLRRFEYILIKIWLSCARMVINFCGPFQWHGFILTQAWILNCMIEVV